VVLKSEKKVLMQSIIFFILLFVLSIFSSIYFDDGGIINGFKYSIFLLFGMFVPGMALLVFLKPNKLTQIEILLYSFILGYGYSLVIYFFMVPFGLKDMMRVVYFVISIVSLIYLIYIYRTKAGWFGIENDVNGLIICCIIGSLLLLLEIIMSCALHMLPINRPTSTYQDFLFGIGNTIACTKEYPIVDFRAIFLENYSYHYIYNIHLAVMKIVLDMPAFHLTAFYSYMQVTILLVGGSYLFFRNILGRRKKGIALGMIMVLFTTGYEVVCMVVQLGHMYMTPNNFDIAMAFAMILVAVIYQQTKCDKLNKVYFIVSLISFVISFGSKAPVGIIAVGFCGILGILYIVTQKGLKIVLPYLFLFILFGLVIYLNVLSGNAEQNVKLAGDLEGKSTYALGNLPEIEKWLIQIFGNPPKWFINLFLGIYYSFVSYYPIFIIFSLGILGFFIFYKKIEIVDISLIMITLLSVIITMAYAHLGGSQVYFIMAITPFVTVFGLRGIYVILSNNKQGYCKKTIKCICILCALIGVLNGWYASLPEYYADEFKYALSCISSKKVDIESSARWISNVIYPEEYEAYKWLRENTGDMDILIGDRCTNAYDIYCEGVFSERYIFIPLEDDKELINACYRGEEKAIHEIVEKKNVKYMIQTFRVTPKLDISESLGEIVFENKAIRIYKLWDDRSKYDES